MLATPARDGPSRARELSGTIGVQPITNRSRTLGRVDFVRYFEGDADARRPRAFVAGSDIVKEMTEGAADSIVEAMAAWPESAGSATAIIESLSGAVRDVAPGDTAFPWRRHAASVQWYVETPSPATVDSANEWLVRPHEAVQANSVGGYVNYVEHDIPAARYFDGNMVQLNVVRHKYDPGGFMYSGMSY